MITEDPRPYSRWKLEVEPQDTRVPSFRRFGDDLGELLLWAAQYHNDVGPVFSVSMWEWDPVRTPKRIAPVPVAEDPWVDDKAFASPPKASAS